jgi:phage terminase large subunit-like protein
MIYAPNQEFAEEVIEECAAFPFGEHDDLVDSTTQAIMRFRQGGFVLHPDDEKQEQIIKTKRNYY